MKNDFSYDRISQTDQETVVLRTLKMIDQKLEKEIIAKRDIIQWQQDEIKRLRSEIVDKNGAIAELSTRLNECRSQSEGNRQLINKLITDIDKLQQNIDWYKRTYESRSLLGVIKDKLKHLFK
jgi:uncharacterized coiled-coil DUF342 family protein